MADAAEVLQFEPFPSLELVEPAAALFVDADSVPELQFARSRAAQEATRILETNRQMLCGDEFDDVPIPVDALGTAKRVVDAEAAYGRSSEAYRDAYQGLLLDCSRLYGEATRKNTWEYFPEVRQELDPISGEYWSHGKSVLETVTGGLSPVAEPEERDRRINESVEERTYSAVGQMTRLVLHETVSLITISECPDWAIKAYRSKRNVSHGGYVPGIEKLMLRGMRITEHDGRYEEQLALSGVYITPRVVRSVLVAVGQLEGQTDITKTELQGKQFIDNTHQSVIGFGKLLDDKASEVTGKNIFMGEEVPADFVKDYDTIAQQAEVRRRKVEPESRALANYLVTLTKQQTDKWAAEGIVDAYLKKRLFGIVERNPEQAEIIFDKATALGLREVARLEELGLIDEANIVRLDVEKNAPAPSYCGAGSCGLEAVLSSSKEAKKARELGLKGDLLHDKVRPCPKCKTMNAIYDLKGGKACTGCDFNNTGKKASQGSKKQQHQVAA